MKLPEGFEWEWIEQEMFFAHNEAVRKIVQAKKLILESFQWCEWDMDYRVFEELELGIEEIKSKKRKMKEKLFERKVKKCLEFYDSQLKENTLIKLKQELRLKSIESSKNTREKE